MGREFLVVDAAALAHIPPGNLAQHIGVKAFLFPTGAGLQLAFFDSGDFQGDGGGRHGVTTRHTRMGVKVSATPGGS